MVLSNSVGKYRLLENYNDSDQLVFDVFEKTQKWGERYENYERTSE